MKIGIFTLCDGVYSYEDKLMILGVYDVLRLQNFTASPVALNIAAHILFEAAECGDNTLRIEGVELRTGMKILDLKNDISISERDKIGTGVLNIALSGIPVIFPAEGQYKFTLNVEGKGSSEILLNVMSV